MSFRSQMVTAALAVILGLLLATSPALAECDSDNAIFEDDFEFLDPSWGPPTDNIFVEDGVLVLKGFWGQTNGLTLNEAANVCVDTTIVDAPAADNSPIGLVWWWESWDNYYYLFYWSDSAWVEVRRMVKGQAQNVAALETLALKQGPGQTNHIELRLKPKDATLFVNGTEVTRFKGKPPKGGGLTGVYGTSPEDKPATFQFDNFVVSTPAE
jgi:hypothetical protein